MHMTLWHLIEHLHTKLGNLCYAHNLLDDMPERPVEPIFAIATEM
jgi:hypothetical protein